MSFADDAEVARRRATGASHHPAGVVEAFQSYPLLLTGDGEVPRLLREPGPDIDLGLLVKDARGERHLWRGIRRVPLGLMAEPR